MSDSKKASMSGDDRTGRRIFFLSQHDVRKNRSDPVHIMNICNAFSICGREVELITPRIRGRKESGSLAGIWEQYAMEPSFRVWELPTLLWNTSAGSYSKMQRAWGTLWFLLVRWVPLLNPENLVYVKCYTMATVVLWARRCGLIRARVVFEKPDWDAGHEQHQWVCERVDAVVCGNKYLEEQVLQNYRVGRERVTAMSALTQYTVLKGRPPRPKSELMFTPGRRHVTYSGKTVPGWLEVLYILEAAGMMPDAQFIIIGGTGDSIDRLKDWCRERNITNVTFPGFLSVPDLFSYLSHSDVLVSYYDTKDPISALQRNPGKMTLYACTGNPVIVADLSSMRELFAPDSVFFVPPDDPPALAKHLKAILADPAEASARGGRLMESARKNDYPIQYGQILKFIENVPLR